MDLHSSDQVSERKETVGGMTYFGSQFEGITHHGTKDMFCEFLVAIRIDTGMKLISHIFEGSEST